MDELVNFEKTPKQLKNFTALPIQNDRDKAGIIQACLAHNLSQIKESMNTPKNPTTSALNQILRLSQTLR